MTQDWTIRSLRSDDRAAVDNILDRAFGPERHGRTAYRLRSGVQSIAALCFVAEGANGTLLGSIECWPVALGEGPATTDLTLLGPLGVDPDHQGIGVGRALLRAATEAADSEGQGLMMLIGDEDYYAPFGFRAGLAPDWALPGPFERARLLVRNPAGKQLPLSGTVTPRQPRALGAE